MENLHQQLLPVHVVRIPAAAEGGPEQAAEDNSAALPEHVPEDDVEYSPVTLLAAVLPPAS